MPREIMVVDWCDVCFREGVKAEGKPEVVRIGYRKSDKPRQPVFCDVHRKEYLGKLEELLADVAVFDGAEAPAPVAPTPKAAPAASTRAVDDPTTCLVCERVFGIEHVAKNPASAHTHRLQRHGLSAVAYRAWLRGDADVIDADKETLKVEVSLKPLPPLSDKKWVIPDDFRCDVPGCNKGPGGGPFVVDPREYSDQTTAYRVLGSHKAQHGR